VVAGLVVRLALAPFTAWSPDFGPWLARIEELQYGVPLYQNLNFSYPPLFAYMIALFVSPVAHFLGVNNIDLKVPDLEAVSINSQLVASTISHPLITLAVKLPVIIADVGTAIVLAVLVRSRGGSRRQAQLAAAAWLFNPLAIWVAAVHGQFDPIPVFLTVLALGQAWRREWLGAGLALSLGILFKLYPLYLVPPFMAFAVFDAVTPGQPFSRPALRASLKNLALLGVGVLIPLDLFGIPLMGSQFQTAVFSRSETSNVGAGLNLWFPVVLPPAQSFIERISGAYSIGLMAILVLGLVLLIWRAARMWRERREIAILETVIAVLALVLLTSSRINPQFIVWILPFLILAWVLGGGHRLAALALSIMPVLFYVAQLGGYPIPLLAPTIAYYSWPVTARQAASALSASLGRMGPSNIALRYWLMFVVAGLTVGFVISVFRVGHAKMPPPEAQTVTAGSP
jgi:hypothetical protein